MKKLQPAAKVRNSFVPNVPTPLEINMSAVPYVKIVTKWQYRQSKSSTQTFVNCEIIPSINSEQLQEEVDCLQLLTETPP